MTSTNFILPSFQIPFFTITLPKTIIVMNRLLIFGLGGQEILFIALIVLLIFGGRKIPELMKGLGKGIKSFKEGMNGVEEDLKTDNDKDKK